MKFLGWLLFALALVAGTAVAAVMWMRRSALPKKADATAEERANAAPRPKPEQVDDLGDLFRIAGRSAAEAALDAASRELAR